MVSTGCPAGQRKKREGRQQRNLTCPERKLFSIKVTQHCQLYYTALFVYVLWTQHLHHLVIAVHRISHGGSG